MGIPVRVETFAAKVRNRERAVLLALGDSLTVGYMVSRGYLDFVEQRLRGFPIGKCLEVRNAGVCGDTAAGGLRRLRAELSPPAPDLLLVQFGLNDCVAGVTAAEFGRSLTAIAAAFRAANPAGEVVFVPPPPVDHAHDEALARPFRNALERAAAEVGAPAAPVLQHWRGYAGTARLWLSDGVHPTEDGYRLIADAVMAVIL